MELVVTILSAILPLITIVQVLFISKSIKSKSYLQYRKQLEEFEKTKQRIEDELNNDRKGFE